MPSASPNPPTVVHVSPTYFGDRGVWGGGERYALELARAMAKRMPTRLVSFAETGERFRLGPLSVELLPTRFHHKSGLNPVSELLPRALWGAGLIHVHQYATAVATLSLAVGRLRRRPVFVTDLGGEAPNWNREVGLDRRATGMVAISDFSARFFPEFRDRRAIIYGGIDQERFFETKAPRRHEVVFVGRLLPHKGVDVLIEAVDADTPLHLFGRSYDGDYRRELERLAEGKRVTFHGDASDDDIVNAYRSARVVVLPSVHRTKGGEDHPKAELLGLTLIEAMACGTPVISSDAGAMPEVVEHGESGWVVPQNDPLALGQRIALLLDDDALWGRMSAKAAARARDQFTWDRVTDRCLAAYRQLGAFP